ncbi:MAG TPA: adenylate/guanylate cyclase domain-containing protein [Spirochaetota bacterium]|nr:adenylate/guanylate cyclase domain-containing protein [Spirochaetota bacterium]
MELPDRPEFFKRITFKVPLLVAVVLILGLGVVVSYYLRAQNETIRRSKESEVMQEGEILYTAVKNNMLAGEAPIAVQLFRDFERRGFASMIGLYRADGVSAFSDNKTIETVNRNLGKSRFMDKKRPAELRTINDPLFLESVTKVEDIFIRDTRGDKKNVLIYKPLLNQPKCSGCHGIDHAVRGVIVISSPFDEVYRMARNNIIFSVLLYVVVLVVLTGAIILFLRRYIIGRILELGRVVKGVGSGDFVTKIDVDSVDEIGELGNELNSMIDGLRERFMLSKFVSRSTLEHIKGEMDIFPGGEKRLLTVLFTDIRNFTEYSENRNPETVLEMLNTVMSMQARIIHKNGGDIDKYVGDEIMAVFDGEDMVYRAAKSAEEIRREIRKMNEASVTPIYIGFGINTGEMIAGNMGSVDRADRTVIGDAVNLGARLCSIAGRNTIVLSEHSHGHISERGEFREQKPVRVKGKEKTVKIYTLVRTL